MIVGHTNEIFCEFNILKHQQEQKIICSVSSYIIPKQLVLKRGNGRYERNKPVTSII